MKTNHLLSKHWLGIVAFALFLALGLAGCRPRHDADPIPAPISTYGFAQCLDDPEGFYVIGGRDGWEHPLNRFLRYSAAESVWYRLPPLPEASAGLAATCWQGRIYAVTPEQHLFIYDIQGEYWSEATNPDRSAWGAALGAWQGKLYLVSGAPSEWDSPVDMVSVYDIAADSWIPYIGESIPVPTHSPGYTQAGPYLFVVGGFGLSSPGQNVDATQRFNLSSLTWELGPIFTSARAAFSLSITDYNLYAAGGDINGGSFLDETVLVENLNLTTWPLGSWTDTGYGAEPALMFDSGGFCTEVMSGGEIWTVGGAQPDEQHLNPVTTNQWGDIADGCLHGVYNLQASSDTQEGIGFPGTEVSYSISLNNSGGIPDAYEISIASDWPTMAGMLLPIWPGNNGLLTVTVTIPMDVLPGETDTAQVTITSQGDPSKSVTVSLTTGRYGELILEPAAMDGSGRLGEAITYPITLRNATGQMDTFSLELGYHDWATTLSVEQIGPLPDGGEQTFTVVVNVPEDAAWYNQDEVLVTARSQANPAGFSGTSQITTTAYAPPDLSYSPQTLESIQFPNQTVTQTLTISNGNGVTLTFNVGSLPGIEDLLVYLPLDEPAGATLFQDTSGNGYHGFCSGSSCPDAGVPGKLGSALEFDGIDSYFQVPEFKFGGPLTIAAWVYVRDTYANFARIIDFGNGPESDNIVLCQWSTTGQMGISIRRGGNEMTLLTNELIPSNQWVHVAAVVDQNGIGYIYWNGSLVASGSMHTPNNILRTLQYIARSAWGSDAYFNGLIDEFVLYDRALTPEEVQILYLGGSYSNSPWLSVDPISGTVPTDGSIPIQVTFDASGLQPGTYSANVNIANNDPLNSLAQIPVTMTVAPTPSMGWVEGYITDLRTGDPLEATIVAEGQPYTITSDADTGYYRLWLEEGSYNLEISASGYVTQTVPLDITAQQGVPQDFALLLDAPWLGYSPENMNVTQMIGQVTTQTLSLSNTGTSPLNFNIEEDIHGAVLALHLDEPAGSTIFLDNSGYGNNAICFDDTCPIAGVPGVIDSSVQFDGLDDYLQVPHNPEFDQIEDQDKVSITAWVNVIDIYGNLAPFTQYESDGDTGWGFYITWTDIVFGSYNTDSVCNYNFNANEWYHVAVSYDRSLGTIQFYVNGSQICNNNFSADIMDTTDDPGFIGFNIPGGNEYSPGFIDELFIFNRALTPEEIMDLYLGTTYGNISWLSMDPISGSIPINETFPVQVEFNATNLQPDTYTSTLYISSNDSLNPLVQIPVTMTVEPTPSMGWVDGIITDLRTGEPLEASIIAEGQPYTVNTDAETGHYLLWLDTINEPTEYTLQVSAEGYVSQTVDVEITAQQGATQDFALLLDAPWLGYSPESLEITQEIGQVITQTLTISNNNGMTLTYALTAGSLFKGLVAYYPFNGNAVDESRNGNDGTTVGATLTTDRFGNPDSAYSFDGINDYIYKDYSPASGLYPTEAPFAVSAWFKTSATSPEEMMIASTHYANRGDGYFLVIDSANASRIRCAYNVTSGAVVYSTISVNDGQWHHVVCMWAEDMVYLYVDAELQDSVAAVGTISYPNQARFKIGYSDTAGSELRYYFNGSIDDVALYDRRLTEEEILTLYAWKGGSPVTWLSTIPISGTVPIHSSIPVQVIFSATNLQPDTYTTTLYITSNDPLNPLLELPVTMTVTPPSWYGTLSGNISTPGYCDNSPSVLEGAEILIESSTGVTWTVTTDEAGKYNYWLDENGSPYTVTTTLPGYETALTSGVSITGGQTTTLDFSLPWLVPCLGLAPEQLPMTLQMGTTATMPLVITNTGAAPTSFEIIERDAGPTIPVLGAAVELTIPSGPDVAPAGSAVAAGPYTPRQASTYRIQPHIMLVNPPKVLLLHADDGDGQWIRDQLLAYGDLAGVDSFYARLDTPTLAELVPYDVVLTWSNYPYADPVGMGNVLADYVDGGGYVINLMYALGEHGWEMQGRFTDEGYNAIQGGLVKYETSCLGNHQPTNFIFLGVEDVCDFYRLSDTSLSPGASAIARWQDGEIFVARSQNRSVISITGYVGYYYRWTGQMDRVVHNAILWFILGDDIPWLETEPISGTVPADGGSVNINVIFDTIGYQPSEFAADLLLFSNDPVRSPIQVPVSLNIIPTPTMGWVEGVITDLRTGEPLQATIIADGQPYSVTSDADTGEYLLWLEQGTYTLTASAPGYVTQSEEIEITMQAGTTQDFALLLDAPWLEYNPQEFEVTVGTDQVITRTLTISNVGMENLEFHLYEGVSGAILSLHLDEPAGEKIFLDSSGYGNHGSCAGDSCPQAGDIGIFGAAVHFDGTNDYIEIPHNNQFDQIENQDELTIAAWVNIDNLDQSWYAILDQYEFTDDSGWEFTLYNSGIGGCDLPFTFGEWFHIVGAFDFSHEYSDYYFNGELICHFVGGSDLPDTSGEPAYIGFSPTGPDEYAAGLLDEIYVFNRPLSAEEIRIIYTGGSLGDVPWLSTDPTSGTVPVDNALPIQVTFDSTDLLPATYTTTLFLTSNDPLLHVTEIPITMTVTGDVTPTSVSISGVEQGWTGREYVFTATVSPETAGTPITYTWQADGQLPVTHIGGITDMVSYTWDTPGIKVIVVTASNAYGEVMDTHPINILELPYHYYLPLLHKEGTARGNSGFAGLEIGWLPAGTIGMLPLIPLYMLWKRRD